MISDYGVLLVAYDKLHRGELTKKQFVEIVKKQVDKSPFLHIGANGACYYQFTKGAFDPRLKEAGKKKDSLWLSGKDYDFMFIRFNKANRKEIVTFFEATRQRSTRLIIKRRR